jgi:hypothetical protein
VKASKKLKNVKILPYINDFSGMTVLVTGIFANYRLYNAKF